MTGEIHEKLAGISDLAIFNVVSTLESAIEDDQIDGAHKLLAEWGVTRPEVTAELLRRRSLRNAAVAADADVVPVSPRELAAKHMVASGLSREKADAVALLLSRTVGFAPAVEAAKADDIDWFETCLDIVHDHKKVYVVQRDELRQRGEANSGVYGCLVEGCDSISQAIHNAKANQPPGTNGEARNTALEEAAVVAEDNYPASGQRIADLIRGLKLPLPANTDMVVKDPERKPRPDPADGSRAVAPVDVYLILKRAYDNGMLDREHLSSLSREIDSIYSASPTPEAVVPYGWKLVPEEPTNFMIASAVSVDWRRGDDVIRRIWKRMLSDAPAPSMEKAAATVFDELRDDVGDEMKIAGEAVRISRERNAASSEQNERNPASSKPRLVLLEWSENHRRAAPYQGDEVVLIWESRAIGFRFGTVVECTDGRFTLLSEPTTGRYASLEEAQSAAQADFELRVSSAYVATGFEGSDVSRLERADAFDVGAEPEAGSEARVSETKPKERCVPCNGNGSRYVRHESGYASRATETCADCSGTGFVPFRAANEAGATVVDELRNDVRDEMKLAGKAVSSACASKGTGGSDNE